MKKLTRRVSTGLALLLAGGIAAGAGIAGIGGASAATTADEVTAANATGFIYGSDSQTVPIGSGSPLPMTHLSGSYGGYMGMAGNWARQEGCSTGNFLAYSGPNGAEANSNYIHHGVGVGEGVYWYMGGPGVDPHYNGKASEAESWGTTQAEWTLAAMKKVHVIYPVVWADIEFPEIAPAHDNGWTAAYTSPCSGVVKGSITPASGLARDEFNAFDSYIIGHSSYKVGVYSDAATWTDIMGTGTNSLIPNTYEWTYEAETANLSQKPSSFCLSGEKTPHCAVWFGGQNSASKYAVMWQWSGGGGVRNPYGDYDQIYESRLK
ncbi:MAG TPA: hypothetical protein VMU95_40315 [Trebonia sp.]|nr:hypothetical protein [Trebonia sp.]